MGEEFSIAAVFNDISGGLVDIAEANTCLDSFGGIFVGFFHQFIDLSLFFTRPLFKEEGPGHVGTIAFVGAADIKEHGIADLKFCIIRHVMGIGTVLAEGDDGWEGEAFSTQFLVDV